MSKEQHVSELNAPSSPPHIICLHGPWQYEPVALTQLGPSGESIDLPGELPPQGTLRIPSDWSATLGSEFRGRVRYKRRFGRPSNLDADEQIDLILHEISGLATITLNGSHLRETKIGELACRIDVTSLLLARNELEIEVNLPRGSHDIAVGGIVGEVQLVISQVSR
jgi:hypothetical protein